MGRYICPQCSGPTSVIETRLSNLRIKRRRACPDGHRFNTLEVHANIQAKLHSLIDWIGAHIDPEYAEYAHSQVDTIVLGTVDEGEEKEE